jgi:type VII secretion integral membrane protein EccD
VGTTIRGAAPGDAAALVRVTVTGGSRRVDLVVPGAVPLVELLPELAGSLGLLGSHSLDAGYRLVTPQGRTLATDCGLTAQGVVDGAFLAVVVGVGDEPSRRYDDVAEAMADVVTSDFDPWNAATGGRAALGAAMVLLLVGVGALLSRPGSQGAGGVATGVAAALVLGAVAQARLGSRAVAPVAVALTGCVYAGAAGLVLGAGAPGPVTSLLATGGGFLAAGVLAAVGLTEGRALLLPPVVVGAVLLATGLTARASRADPAIMLTAALAGAVVAGHVFPALALAATGTSVPPLQAAADLTRDVDPVDVEGLSSDARAAHQIMVAMSATVGILLALVAPSAVSLGLAGTLVPILGCLVVTLRTRHCHSAVGVLVGLGSGLLGLVSTAASVLWLHPDWRLTAALVLAASGVALLATTVLPGRPGLSGLGSSSLGRLGDGVESLALLAMTPALVLATGLLSTIQARVG